MFLGPIRDSGDTGHHKCKKGRTQRKQFLQTIFSFNYCLNSSFFWGGIAYIGINYNETEVGDNWALFLSDETKVCDMKVDKNDFHCNVMAVVKSKYILILLLTISVIFFLCGVLGLFGYCMHSINFIMVWIVAAFHHPSHILYYNCSNSKSIIQFVILLVAAYFWLCVVSYVQILKAMQKLGLNEVQSILNKNQDEDDDDTNSIVVSHSNLGKDIVPNSNSFLEPIGAY
ncbi:unnamed protein product [Lepeophtheirus salmonis]|uniref:(salmon louse) hypothetical protein n=1 Tax=Lepeophtheirus salmonis TaxID=72036 RepID=A0A7R8HAH0_LEPSM|nr:unnamed protein product [Lepeophtheirus salmonis]CAF2971398.1 unnamed protein product [Lepeophtheirus salmonis]